MSILRRLLHRRPAARVEPVGPERSPEGAEGILVHDLVRQLSSPDAGERSQAALMLEALRPTTAVRPLMRAWVSYGDPAVAVALAAYGARVTPVAGAAARDLSLGGSQRARALDLLGRSADPAARDALRSAAVDPDPVVHIAAAVALVRVGDELGEEGLRRGLEGRPAPWRAAALRALRAADHPTAGRIAEEHVARFLAEGGAVPAEVVVTMPMLLDAERDLARLLGRSIADAPQPFVLVTGPGTAELSETQRETLAPFLGRRVAFYATARHSAPEQVEVLLAARAASASEPAGSVLLGPVPDALGPYPLPNFLDRPLGDDDACLVVYAGPVAFPVVAAWWRQLAEGSRVPVSLTVVLTNLTLGGAHLGDEAWEIYQRCQDGRSAEFARAYLVHLPEVAGGVGDWARPKRSGWYEE